MNGVGTPPSKKKDAYQLWTDSKDDGTRLDFRNAGEMKQALESMVAVEKMSLEDKIIKSHPGLEEILKDPTLSRHKKKLAMLPVLNEMKQERDSIERRIRDAKAEEAALSELIDWWPLPKKLEKNDCSRLHRFRGAIKQQRVMFANGNLLADGPINFDWEKVQPFVVEHDWASAFANATDYADGTYNLPYSHCAFEFRISGRNVVVLAAQPEDQPVQPFLPFMEFGGYWVCTSDDSDKDEALQLAYSQIKAICIALDAEVAVRNAVRVSEKVNRKREAEGREPFYSYHVVSLNRRYRIGNPAKGGGASQGKRRLHFRRGHWRHYAEFKTWVRWTLVGNPELGFIDKEYRL